MTLRIKTPPALEPITLQEAKDHMHIDDSNQDALISELIKAAREHCENYTQRPLVTQTWTYYADCFDGSIELKPNLQSISSIKYIDGDGAQQTFDSAKYKADTAKTVGEAYLAYDESWPYARNVQNSVEVEFIAGYGNPADVPASIKSAMLLLVGHWFVNREAVIVGVSAGPTPMSVDLLLGSYRVIHL